MIFDHNFEFMGDVITKWNDDYKNNLYQLSMKKIHDYHSPHHPSTTNHVNHVNHDSAINELVNQAATKSHQRSSLEAKHQGDKVENGDETLPFILGFTLCLVAPKSFSNSVPKLLVLFPFSWTFSSKTRRHQRYQRVPGSSTSSMDIPIPNGSPWSASR